MKKIYLSLVLMAGLGAGCARMQFTHDMRQHYNLTPEILQQMQVYVSDPIHLERRFTKKDAVVDASSALNLKEAELIRKVHIPRGTPGVITAVEDDRLTVSFEEGASLVFGSSSGLRGKLGGLYNLMALSWTNGYGEVLYGKDTYRVLPGSGAVHLMVNARNFDRTKIVRKTLDGIRVGDPMLSLPGPANTPE